MKTMYIDPETRDLVLDKTRSIKMVENKEEAAQHVRLLLSTRLNEWFLNTQYGLDHGTILGRKFPQSDSDIRAAIYEAVHLDERNIQIHSMNLDYNEKTRVLTINLILSVEDEMVETEVTI